jgi:hypothetical protein
MGGHDPGHEDAGQADGHDLVEEHFRAEQHQAALDEELHLAGGENPLGRADGVGDDHAQDDAPGFRADAVIAC